MTDDLLPCPFCGGAAEMNIHRDDDKDPLSCISFVVVRCTRCGISKERPSPNVAANFWNTRAAPPLMPVYGSKPVED